MSLPRRLLASMLKEPGPIRSAALRSFAASMRKDTGLCSDRARIAMARALDKAIDAAHAAAPDYGFLITEAIEHVRDTRAADVLIVAEDREEAHAIYQELFATTYTLAAVFHPATHKVKFPGEVVSTIRIVIGDHGLKGFTPTLVLSR